MIFIKLTLPKSTTQVFLPNGGSNNFVKIVEESLMTLDASVILTFSLNNKDILLLYPLTNK